MTDDIRPIPDLLRPGLTLVFCGYNPSLRSGATGHHYAHPGNRFWRVIHAAGITERLYRPEEDAELLARGIGFTNIVSRPTRRADELTRDEIRAGAAALREKLERHQPRAVVYTGVGVYQWLRGATKVAWGVQAESAVPGIIDVVVPSPSGLNRMTFDELVEQYRVLARFLS
jgi:TDG/mug DNA glycosylase family protein